MYFSDDRGLTRPLEFVRRPFYPNPFDLVRIICLSQALVRETAKVVDDLAVLIVVARHVWWPAEDLSKSLPPGR